MYFRIVGIGHIYDNSSYGIGNYPIARLRGARTVTGSSNSVINSTVNRGFFRTWMAGLEIILIMTVSLLRRFFCVVNLIL